MARSGRFASCQATPRFRQASPLSVVAASACSNSVKLSFHVAACRRARTVAAATWRDSFTLFEHALAVTTDNGLAWRNLGVAWQDARRPDLAIPALQESLRLLPQDARTWLNLAIANETAGHGEAADACFAKALRMSPRDPFIWFNVGIAQGMRRDLAGLVTTRATLRDLDGDLSAELDRRLGRMGALP